MEGQTPNSTLPMEGQTLPTFLTFDDVQDRLVEAMLTCWRHPDRERGWLRVKAMWPDVMAEPGDYDARGGDLVSDGAALRPAALTRRDIDEMEEAFGWVEAIAPDDRKLVGLAVSMLARGRREVPWRNLLRPMGLTRGADGLRMRYGRAMAAVAARANGGNPQGIASTPKIDT